MSESGDAQQQAKQPVSVALQIQFESGLALHQQGKLGDADCIYREVLRQQPSHFGALHMLGVVAIQTQRPQQGVSLITRAIRLNPNDATAHINLGKALLDLMRPEEALASIDQAIALTPDFAEAHQNRGWPAPGSEDTELGVLMEPEVRHGEAKVYTRVQA